MHERCRGEEGAAEESAERGATRDEGEAAAGRLLRCVSQSSLDESSQRPAPPSPAAPAHAAKLLEALARLRRDGALCDVRLRALPQHDGVWAHRAVLAACSPYFRAMFTQFDERTQPTVTIQVSRERAVCRGGSSLCSLSAVAGRGAAGARSHRGIRIRAGFAAHLGGKRAGRAVGGVAAASVRRARGVLRLPGRSAGAGQRAGH